MNKKVIPTALPDENIGIASMTVRYAQCPDCNDESCNDQFLTVEAVNYDDGDEKSVMEGKQGYYLVLSTERWAINDPSELNMVVRDFTNRLFASSEMPRVKFKGNVVIEPPIIEAPTAEELEHLEQRQESKEDPKAKKASRQAKAVDVLTEEGWVTYESASKAAKALGVSGAWIGKSLELGKTVNGQHVRWHQNTPEEDAALEASLAEIKERDKQPYEISRT
jgi:hypothetical protein